MNQYVFNRGDAIEAVAWLSSFIAGIADNRQYVISVKQYHKKRSLDANAYCWALIGKLGDALRMDKDAVYLEMLKAYGQSEIVSVRSDIDVKGYFKYYEPVGTGTVNGSEFTHYKVFKGSSEYDTREMSILIDGVVDECKTQGIETMTPAELAVMKEEWAK